MNEFQPVNVADIYAKADAANANAQNMQINAYKLKSAQNEDAKQLAMENLYKSAVSHDGTINHEAVKTGLMQLGMPDKAAAYQENLNKQKMGELKLGDEYKSRHTQNMMQLVYDPKPDLAHKIIDQDVAQGFIKPEEAQGLHDMVPNDPEQIRQMAWTLLKHSQAPDKQLEQYSREQLYAGDAQTQAELQPVATNGFDMSTPEKRAQVMSDINRIVDPAEKAAVMASITGSQPTQQASKLPYDPAKIKKARMLGLTDDAKAMQEANDKFSEGYNKPFFNNGDENKRYQEFDINKSKSGATNVSIDNKAAEKGYTKLSELDAETINDMGKNAKQAREALPMVDRMIRNEGNAFSGVFAPGLTGLAQAADALGFATPELKKQLVSTQLFSQGADAYAASMLKALMGSNQLSNADLGMVQKIAPRLADSPEARREIMTYARKRIGDMQKEYQAARKYYDENNASLTGYEVPIDSTPDAAPAQKGLPQKTVTLQDVFDTAKASGKSNEQVMKDLKDRGYSIGK
jgi:hypothetical protein